MGGERGLSIGYVSLGTACNAFNLEYRLEKVMMVAKKMIYPQEARRKRRKPKREERNKTGLVERG